MALNFNQFEPNFRQSLPITVYDLSLYPVLYKDNDAYNVFIGSLLDNPIYYPDERLSSLPRLYFLTDILSKSGEYANENPVLQGNIFKLYGLLGLVLKDQQFDFQPTHSGNIALRVWNSETPDKVSIINAKKFEDIREIILRQNATDYDDTYIHPDIQKWINEQKKREKANSNQTETEEDHIEALMLEFKCLDENAFYNFPIRRVKRLLEKITSREIYNAQMSGMMSGMVKFSEQPQSWVSTKPHQSDFDKYLKELK